MVAWVGFVQPECTLPLGMWNFPNIKPEFLLNGKHPMFQILLVRPTLSHTIKDICYFKFSFLGKI